MNPPLTRDPFLILKDIERRSHQHAMGLPQQEEVPDDWVGIGFRIGDARLVAEVGEVSEIIRIPTLTTVPGVKPWLRGMANIRGRLVPVVDVRGCLGGGFWEGGDQSRVLVVQHEGFSTGLLVDEVLGLKHFVAGEYAAGAEGAEAFISDYVGGGFTQAATYWGRLQIVRLVCSSALLQVTH